MLIIGLNYMEKKITCYKINLGNSGGGLLPRGACLALAQSPTHMPF